MMKRETLLRYHRTVRKFGHYPTAELERQLIDSHLEALDELAKLSAAQPSAPSEPVCPFDCDRCHDVEECPCENCGRLRA